LFKTARLSVWLAQTGAGNSQAGLRRSAFAALIVPQQAGQPHLNAYGTSPALYRHRSIVRPVMERMRGASVYAFVQFGR